MYNVFAGNIPRPRRISFRAMLEPAHVVRVAATRCVCVYVCARGVRACVRARLLTVG